jgi:uncharacterized protein
MDPLESSVAWFLFDLLKLQPEGNFAAALQFFIYDTIKVFLLLIVMIFLISIVRSFITQKKIRQVLGRRKEGVGNLLAALVGIPTPFCSCSAVPLFITFLESGIPLGVTMSFLISSPMINEIALALLFSLFGWQVALLYVVAGLVVAVGAGIIIGRLHLEGELEKSVFAKKGKGIGNWKMSWSERVAYAQERTVSMALKVGPYIVLGVGIGAAVHGYVPQDFLAQIAGRNNPFAVPVAVLIGIPLYSNAAGTIPIVQALMAKGMAGGTALALMMSITALSLPEMVILRKVMKPKLIAIFALIMFVSFVLVGWLFNAILA